MEDVLRESVLLPDRALRIWRVVQTVVWLVGVAILAALLFVPKMESTPSGMC